VALTALREGLQPLPPRMRSLPIDERGYPVPFFVEWIDGKPDHRIPSPEKASRARRLGLCWVCGEPLGRFKSFAVGPMCALNRISGEPPAHRECAEYSARNCPFLSRPQMRRRKAGMPDVPLHMQEGNLMRNPGATLVWTTLSYKPFAANTGGHNHGSVLYEMGEPVSMQWFCQGREATREEIIESIDSGLPLLYEQAPPDELEAGKAEIKRRYNALLALLP